MISFDVSEDAPSVWALLARRPGDNAQIETLGEATGLRVVAKRLALRKGFEALPNLKRGGSLFSYDAETQAALREGPAPALVIAAGKRSAPAALWLKARTGARLVHLGRTWAPGDWFDAVITTPQYVQAPGPNVVRNLFPLTPAPVASERLAADLAALPRPRLIVAAGGDAAGLSLDVETARALGRRARERQFETGGSLMVATSPRTSRRAAEALADAVAPSDDRLVSPFGQGPNRYRDFLAAADAAMVTEDSVSMVADAVAAGRPVEIFRLRRHEAFGQRAVRTLSASSIGRRAAALGLVDSGRGITAYMDALDAGGWLDGRGRARMAEELAAAAALARRLAVAPRDERAAISARGRTTPLLSRP